MVLQNNYFIEEILPNAILRKLSEEEMGPVDGQRYWFLPENAGVTSPSGSGRHENETEPLATAPMSGATLSMIRPLSPSQSALHSNWRHSLRPSLDSPATGS
jgi:hypothetical protein